MRIGFEQKVITPKLPCMLAGYAKQRTAEVVHDELYVKVVVFDRMSIIMHFWLMIYWQWII